MLFDTHAHYDDPKFDADRDTVLASLPDQWVSLVVNPGCDLPSSRSSAIVIFLPPPYFFYFRFLFG